MLGFATCPSCLVAGGGSLVEFFIVKMADSEGIVDGDGVTQDGGSTVVTNPSADVKPGGLKGEIETPGGTQGETVRGPNVQVQPVLVNFAGVRELAAISGIGPKLAKAIVAVRCSAGNLTPELLDLIARRRFTKAELRLIDFRRNDNLFEIGGSDESDIEEPEHVAPSATWGEFFGALWQSAKNWLPSPPTLGARGPRRRRPKPRLRVSKQEQLCDDTLFELLPNVPAWPPGASGLVDTSESEDDFADATLELFPSPWKELGQEPKFASTPVGTPNGTAPVANAPQVGPEAAPKPEVGMTYGVMPKAQVQRTSAHVDLPNVPHAGSTRVAQQVGIPCCHTGQMPMASVQRTPSMGTGTPTAALAQLSCPQQKKYAKALLDTYPKHITFDGRGNWKAFRVQFTEYAETVGWSERECHTCLRWSLKGKALDYYAIISDSNGGMTYSELLRRLEDRFGDRQVSATAQACFQQAVQGQQEDLQDWGDRVLTLAERAHCGLPEGFTAEQAVNRFLQGLTDRDAGHAVSMQSPDSVQTAIQQVRKYQQVRIAMYGRPRGSTRQSWPDDVQVNEVGPQNEDPPDFMKALQELERRLWQSLNAENHSGGGSSSSAPRTCFGCGGEGHFKRDCPKGSSLKGRGHSQ